MGNRLCVVIVGTNALADALASLFNQGEFIDLSDSLPEYSTDMVPDIVIETENLDMKKKAAALQTIERHVPAKTLIVSSILGVSSTQAASWLTYPSRLAGFAAFADLKNAELIELTAALQMDPCYKERANELFAAIGKEVEWVVDETGAVFPRILSMIINEAAFAWMENVASAEDIDTAMLKGTNYPSGPLTWADQIGLDDVYAVLTGLHRDLGEDRYRPAPILRKLFHAGWLGKKKGRGFYQYADPESREMML